MKHLYATYKSQGFRIISVSCEQNRTYWLRGNDRLKLPWTTLRSPARKGCALDLYSIIGISALILIDRDGTIIAVPNSVEELKAKRRRTESEARRDFPQQQINQIEQ